MCRIPGAQLITGDAIRLAGIKSERQNKGGLSRDVCSAHNDSKLESFSELRFFVFHSIFLLFMNEKVC